MIRANSVDDLTQAIIAKLPDQTLHANKTGQQQCSYQLSSARSRAQPFGRYQVHVQLKRDSSEGIALFNDYGQNSKGASSTRDNINLNNLDAVSADIAQYLTDGTRT